MEPPRLRCIVVVPDGPSRRVGPSGLIIGRQRDCDIVVADPSASRRHALVRLTGDGAEVVPLGKAPVDVNGAPVARAHPLGDGDRLALPGLALVVRIELPRPDRGAPVGFVLERTPSGSFGIAHSPFVAGGGDGDDLIVKGWPAGALRFHVAQDELFVEVHAGEATRGEGSSAEPIADGALEPLAIGDVLAYRGERFTIAHASRVATTAVGAAAGGELPSRAVIELLPRGGRVVFTLGAREHAVYLADRRFDLVVTLLRPPPGHEPGDFLSDDTVRAAVWPRKPSVSRPEINMLISRVRRDLVEAGLAGPRLVERAPGGGGTRLRLAPGAVVEQLG